MQLTSVIFTPGRGYLVVSLVAVSVLAQGCGEPFHSCEDSRTCSSEGSAGSPGGAGTGGSSGDPDGISTETSSTSAGGTDTGLDVCVWGECTWDSGAVFAE